MRFGNLWTALTALVIVSLFVSLDRTSPAQASFNLVGLVDCGVKSGQACSLDKTLVILSDDSGAPVKYTIDISWLKPGDLDKLDQDDLVSIEIEKLPDGTLMALRLIDVSNQHGTRNPGTRGAKLTTTTTTDDDPCTFDIVTQNTTATATATDTVTVTGTDTDFTTTTATTTTVVATSRTTSTTITTTTATITAPDTLTIITEEVVSTVAQDPARPWFADVMKVLAGPSSGPCGESVVTTTGVTTSTDSTTTTENETLTVTGIATTTESTTTTQTIVRTVTSTSSTTSTTFLTTTTESTSSDPT